MQSILQLCSDEENEVKHILGKSVAYKIYALNNFFGIWFIDIKWVRTLSLNILLLVQGVKICLSIINSNMSLKRTNELF